MSELKPCPFCGGEATIRREDDMWIVECRHHGWSSKDDDGCSYAGDISLYVEISGKVNHWTHEIEYAEKDIDLAKKKAIEAWNRRAERTCRMEYNERWSHDEYYPTECYNCSECGHMTYDGVSTFCSNCGAKVVDE